jgi:signal transduction histidine kinase
MTYENISMMKGTMNMRKNVCFLMIVFALVLFSSTLVLAESCTKDDVVKAVDAAVAVLDKEGNAGLEKVGKIRFCGDNYVFVNDLNGKTLMHEKPHLIGKVLIGLKDDTGKRFFADFTEVAKSSQTTKNGKAYYNGSGWASYRWPKPGEKTFSPKISYIKGCAMGDENVYVGAGIYE